MSYCPTVKNVCTNTIIVKKKQEKQEIKIIKNSFTVLSEDYVVKKEEKDKKEKKEDLFPPLGLVKLNKPSSMGMNYLEKAKTIPIPIEKPMLKKGVSEYNYSCIQWSDELSSVDYDDDDEEDDYEEDEDD